MFHEYSFFINGDKDRIFLHGKCTFAVMENARAYNDFGSFLRGVFPFKVQKISIDAGFTCPNRDGRVGVNGCTYCNNQTFNPDYCKTDKSIRQQLEEGKAFFGRKYPDMKYLAYFQAYTNTYGSLSELKMKYEEALAVDGVVGLVIGTRPDCVSPALLDYLATLARQTFLVVEYGIECANDATLRLINRGHDFECSRRAIEETAERGIRTGGHIIVGLPGEDAEESLRQADIISALPLTMLKIHQMQVVKGTALERMFAEKPFHVYTVEEYVRLIAEYVQRLRWSLVLERFVSQSPKEMLIAPQWGLKNHEFADLLDKHMRAIGARQGAKHAE